ncbi:MAG TPA: hypothetical protein DCQ09_10790, partial [Alcanivorax sp.]|nr:hypothetical protein [Alcanivorax sp.]
MLETLRLLFSHRLMVVRWRPVIPFLFWPVLLINRNVWVEVNALTGIDSNKAPVRLGVRLAVWLTTRLFNIITVSDVSMDRIKTLARPCRRTYVMPNGFDPDQLIDFEPLCDPRVPPWLVYFGKEQPYYDWELLYQAASELTEKGVISGLRLFGVDQAPSSYPSVFAHGAFDRESLVRALSDIENPILVVHSSASDAARAT